MVLSNVAIVNTGYTPRPLQAHLHASLKRFNVIVCHRRFGKTVFAINHMIHKAIKNKLQMPRYIYVAPTYGEAKRIAWDYFKAATTNFPGVEVNESELRIDIPLDKTGLNTIRFQLLGADRPVSLKGAYYDGVIFDEYASMFPSAWTEAVRPALSDRLGWAIFIGTPKGKNSFYELYENARTDSNGSWAAFIYKASETKVIPESELADMMRDMSEDEYAQELECSFDAAVKGTYYGPHMSEAQSSGRIRVVPYDPSLGVLTAWDLGIGDSTAIWFAQRIFREVRLIDYMEVDGKGIPDIVREIKSKPYVYTTHLLPHDAAARELGTGKTRQEVLRNLGIISDIMPRLKVDDGIQAVRNLLPLCYFDEKNCYRGIQCLKEYRREWDEKAQIFKDKPLHNQWSHGADAFRMLAIGIDKERPLIQPKRQERADIDYNEFGSHI